MNPPFLVFGVEADKLTVYFTFSKQKCAKVLGMSPDKVPTIRIPFLVEEYEVDTNIEKPLVQAAFHFLTVKPKYE